MKRQLIWMAALSLLLTALVLPMAGGAAASANTTATTTVPLTTTTTACGCISTPPPTTTTSLVLTGPDGTNTTTTQTTVPATCGDVNDILAHSDISVSETMAVLCHPTDGTWLSVDCYSYNGGAITLIPHDAALNDGYEYMHLTITANAPFSVVLEASGCFVDPLSWFPEDALQEDGYIAPGSYVLSNSVTSAWADANPIRQIAVTMPSPGSVTVGHLALSNHAVCSESAPYIQTTTRPSFPWDDSTTAPTTTTTNPTVGDVLLPGDADGSGDVSSADARVILSHCLLDTALNGDADFNGDGAVTTADARALLQFLLL